jgi:DNA-binding NtrC family response regulator
MERPMAETGRILVVEDDDAQRKLLHTVLTADGWTVLEASGGEAAMKILETEESIDVILTDLFMPGADGKAVLTYAQDKHPEIPVIILTAHASVDSAVELLHLGAHHYLEKPTKLPELRIVMQRALDATRTRRELARLRRRVRLPSDVVGVSRQMQEILETAIRVAPTATPVLVTGETGTGKEVVARAIHAASARGTFVALNCAAIPPALFESELFGYKRGAFTDARKDHNGLVDSARGGTLFLDEVAEVPLSVQPKLLRFLQDGTFRPLGDTTERTSDARVIAATNRNPEEEIAAGRLRDDLYYRLNIVHLHLPPLRERPVDIPALADHLLKRLADRFELPVADLAPDALAALTGYAWPGNTRELENVLARALALKAGKQITARDLPPNVSRRHTPADRPTTELLTLEEVERRHILRVLELTKGNKLKAAEILGIDRSTLHRKLKGMQGVSALQL